ncbi:MAG: hypothetical protein ACLQBX_11480 [Candidatus Limnocylindrales bacterium]
MVRPRIYSDEQIEQAKHLYVEFGPQEASRQTGISAAWITKKSKEAGLSTVHKENLKYATETAAERWHLKQERLIDGLLDMVLDALERRNQPHVMYVGRARRRVTYPKAPPAVFLAYATVIEKNVKTLARLAEKSAARTEQAGGDTTTDAEYAALRAAMLQEMARRGTLPEREDG